MTCSLHPNITVGAESKHFCENYPYTNQYIKNTCEPNEQFNYTCTNQINTLNIEQIKPFKYIHVQINTLNNEQ